MLIIVIQCYRWLPRSRSHHPEVQVFNQAVPLITKLIFLHRGTGKTILFSCYATDEERAAATKLYPSLAGNASDVALGYNNVSSRVFADNCYASQNKTGQFMSSAFAARDYMRVIDALGEDGLLRYWGEAIPIARVVEYSTC